MTKKELKASTKIFPISIFKFIEKLSNLKSNDVNTYQILKSSSSIAAIYRVTYRASLHQIFFKQT